jgi:hypothetical protein
MEKRMDVDRRRAFREALEMVASQTRDEIGKVIAKEFADKENMLHVEAATSEMFLASLDAIADLIQYGKLGTVAIKRLGGGYEKFGV